MLSYWAGKICWDNMEYNLVMLNAEGSGTLLIMRCDCAQVLCGCYIVLSAHCLIRA